MKKYPEGRDGIWKEIRRRRIFTLKDIEGRSKMKKSSIAFYLKVLIKAGYIQCDNPEAISEAKIYRLVKDNGIQKPNVNEDGSMKEQSSSQKMWNAMKALKRFDIQELTLSTGVSANVAKNYIFWMRRCGFVNSIQGKETRYLFLKSADTGPRAPLIRKGGIVFDQNLCKVICKPTPVGAA